MWGVVYKGNQELNFEEVESLPPGPQEVKIKVHYAGICKADIHEYLLGPILIQPGRIPGHEFSGEIVEVGEEVKNWKAGQKVTASPIQSCKQCDWCKQGLYNYCDNSQISGYTKSGAFAEFVCVNSSQLYPVPPDVSLADAALTEPFACALHALKEADTKESQSILLFGLGPIGLSLIQLAKAHHVKSIIAVGKHDIGKNMAVKCGATEVLDYQDSKLLDKIYQLTDGKGVDTAFECVGKPEALNHALNSICKGGKVVLAGIILTEPPKIDFFSFVLREKRLLGSMAYTNEFGTILDLMEKKLIHPQWLVTDIMELSQTIEKGYQELINNRPGHLKVLVSPLKK